MNIWSMLAYYAREYLFIFSWKDYLEIAFFSMIFLQISNWLRKDITKPLLHYFYGYISLTLFAYYFELNAMYYALLQSAPITALLLLIYHQKTLQKELVFTKKNVITPATPTYTREWLEQLFRACIMMNHKQINVTCIIERTKDIKPFLHAPVYFHTPITKDVLSFIFESSKFYSQKLLWINAHGELVAVNAEWNDSIKQQTLVSDWRAYAHAVSSHSDAIIIQFDALTLQCTVCMNDKIIEHISADQALQFIKKILVSHHLKTSEQKGVYHESVQQNSEQLPPSA